MPSRFHQLHPSPLHKQACNVDKKCLKVTSIDDQYATEIKRIIGVTWSSKLRVESDLPRIRVTSVWRRCRSHTWPARKSWRWSRPTAGLWALRRTRLPLRRPPDSYWCSPAETWTPRLSILPTTCFYYIQTALNIATLLPCAANCMQ